MRSDEVKKKSNRDNVEPYAMESVLNIFKKDSRWKKY